jgi:hypothetical protein
MRPRIRRDLLSHDFPLWRSSGPSVAVPINLATGTLSHDPFHHIADLGASHGRSLFSELSLDVPGTGNCHFADEPTCDPTDHSHVEERPTAPVGLPAGKYRCPSPSSQRAPRLQALPLLLPLKHGTKVLAKKDFLKKVARSVGTGDFVGGPMRQPKIWQVCGYLVLRELQMKSHLAQHWTLPSTKT